MGDKVEVSSIARLLIELDNGVFVDKLVQFSDILGVHHSAQLQPYVAIHNIISWWVYCNKRCIIGDLENALLKLEARFIAEGVVDKFPRTAVIVLKFRTLSDVLPSSYRSAFDRPLPIPELPFYGRTKELEILKELHCQSQASCRYAFLTGVPGMGKSELVCKFLKDLHYDSSISAAYSWVECKQETFHWSDLYYKLNGLLDPRSFNINNNLTNVEDHCLQIIREVVKRKSWVCVLDDILLTNSHLASFLSRISKLSGILIVITSRNEQLLDPQANLTEIKLQGLG